MKSRELVYKDHNQNYLYAPPEGVCYFTHAAKSGGSRFIYLLRSVIYGFGSREMLDWPPSGNFHAQPFAKAWWEEFHGTAAQVAAEHMLLTGQKFNGSAHQALSQMVLYHDTHSGWQLGVYAHGNEAPLSVGVLLAAAHAAAANRDNPVCWLYEGEPIRESEVNSFAGRSKERWAEMLTSPARHGEVVAQLNAVIAEARPGIAAQPEFRLHHVGFPCGLGGITSLPLLEGDTHSTPHGELKVPSAMLAEMFGVEHQIQLDMLAEGQFRFCQSTADFRMTMLNEHGFVDGHTSRMEFGDDGEEYYFVNSSDWSL